MKNIEWIFFDMGYTLVNEDHVHDLRVQSAITELAEKGVSITREQFWEEIYRQGSMGRAPVPSAAKHFGLKKAMKYTTDGEFAYDDARSALLALKAKNYKLGIIANQPLGSAERLTRYGLIDCFDAIFPSAEVGIDKPDPNLYIHALESVGCAADRAVMVGDRPDNDIEPAAAVGMHTVRILRGFFRYRADSDVKPEHTITSLMQLDEIF